MYFVNLKISPKINFPIEIGFWGYSTLYSNFSVQFFNYKHLQICFTHKNTTARLRCEYEKPNKFFFITKVAAFRLKITSNCFVFTSTILFRKIGSFIDWLIGGLECKHFLLAFGDLVFGVMCVMRLDMV